jgi:hypothetical protein
MTYVHIVIMKFKAETTAEQIEAIFKTLQNLLDNKLIPGLTEYSGGAYDSPEGLNKGFTHAFTMKFTDKESRDAYFPHPDHEVVKNMIVPSIDDVICFDYCM